MNRDSLNAFLTKPRYSYLTPEQAACYMLHCLLKADCYATQLIDELAQDGLNRRLSDTNLYAAIAFLTSIGAIRSYEQKCVQRGRPRRMFALEPEFRPEAQSLAVHWQPATGGQT
jgi:DNA-binding PadR family transcriptional regulator